MKKLVIEWKHLEEGGATCCRCSDTGETIVRARLKVTGCSDRIN